MNIFPIWNIFTYAYFAILELAFPPLLVFGDSESGEEVEDSYEGSEDNGLAVPIVFLKSDEMPIDTPVVSAPWAGLAILSPLDI